MALDSWLLDQHQHGSQPSILRFYTWSPIAISLGYHQRRYPPAWHHLRWCNQSVDLVRRPSGGRAVLHQGDLTYSLITSEISGSRLQAYQQLCQFLIQGWRSLGVELSYGQALRNYATQTNCFGLATGADLVTPTGYKLIGSAQLRRKQAILQHGSMRLNPDPSLIAQVFGDGTRDGANSHASDHADLNSELSSTPNSLSSDSLSNDSLSNDSLSQFSLPNSLRSLPSDTQQRVITTALQQSAQDCFNITFDVNPLTPEEWQAFLAQAIATDWQLNTG